MDFENKHKLIKTCLKKSKRISRNLLVGTVAATSILGAMSVSGNALTNVALQTVQASAKKSKTGKTAKLTKKTYIYNSRGKRISKKSLKKNKTIKVYGTKVIKGKTYYNLGHGRYVLAKNVKTAQTVKVTKNVYVYNSQGKRIGKKALKRGRSLKIYGTKTIKGKKYYALSNGGYIPVKNVKISEPAKGNNSDKQTSNNKQNSTNQAGSNSNQPPVNPGKPETPPANKQPAAGSQQPSQSGNSDQTPSQPNQPDQPIIPPTSSDHVEKATIKLPAGYTRERLRAAYKADQPTSQPGHPAGNGGSPEFVKACIQGMKDNTFDTSADLDEADDNVAIDPTNLTAEQQSEISSFALRLINEARADLGLKPWIQSTGVQNLANDVAAEYTKDSWSGYDKGHDVNGIIRAAGKNGLNIDNQYVEDLYSQPGVTETTMSKLKKDVYGGLTCMIFGGVNSSTDPDNPQNCEWHHAGDLLGTQGDDSFDDEENYFGISISKIPNETWGSEHDIHYIHVSSYFINGSYGQSHHSTFNPGKDATGVDIVVPNIGDAVSKKFSIDDFRQEFLKKINESRGKAGFAPVVENAEVATSYDYKEITECQFKETSILTADNLFSATGDYCTNSNIKKIWINAKVLKNGQISCEISMSNN